MKNHLSNFLQCLTIFCYKTQFNAQGSPLLELISPGQDSTLKWIEWEEDQTSQKLCSFPATKNIDLNSPWFSLLKF